MRFNHHLFDGEAQIAKINLALDSEQTVHARKGEMRRRKLAVTWLFPLVALETR